MRFVMFLAAATLFAASTPVVAKAPAFQINNTSWAYVDHGKKVRETVDTDGNYIENAVSGKHVDHGTAVMKGKKVCFTSAMTKEGELCWTTPKSALKVGQSFVATSDKGRKLKVSRIAYVKLEMPK